MIETFIWLLGYQFVGEVLAHGLGLPVPGAVIGMLLLFITLLLRQEVPAALRHNVPTLMTHMSLLFIPAGVGILAFWPLLSAHPLAMAAVLVLATLSTFLITLLAMQWLSRRREVQP
ncbi:CidA/LrgA family protein [Vogesella sp. LIG4]|uniref:CidA/LrgA family protein n=1 Tax=Vogesella sp. LIG4 TaxID=1192162 RepID=UPI00081FBC9B|nr:CidA/LrgA family protein [Vogesella sp. LIG4]SCK04798.1 holin-like protein [Vogesella sp. LIG4]